MIYGNDSHTLLQTMPADCQPPLTKLIAECECAIRRGTTSHPEHLHTLQQQLVAAQDAPTISRTEQRLHDAQQYYVDQIPQDIRQTDLASLTNAFQHATAQLTTPDEREEPRTETSADD